MEAFNLKAAIEYQLKNCKKPSKAQAVLVIFFNPGLWEETGVPGGNPQLSAEQLT